MFKNNQGFTLMEILVALLIVSIGLLGVASLQMRGQQITFVSYYRSQATFLADDIMDRMQVNFQQAAEGAYGLNLNTCPNVDNLSTACDTSSCTTDALKDYDLNNWCFLLRNTLPEAEAIIEWNPVINEYTVRICWKNILDTSKTGCDIDGSEEQVWHHIAPQI
ncbi:type IV pilus modification protein PilV [Candidatus Halobeggiatoa sp. HSG11]|nr:type IV pilus modification protein PilV [Candidatus Halobeggiatoa sp. HSG11]